MIEALDMAAIPPYDASMMETKAAVNQFKLQVDQQSVDFWYYFYFTPPAELVGLSELNR